MRMPQVLRERLPAEPDAGQDYGPHGLDCLCGDCRASSRLVSFAATQQQRLFLGRYEQPNQVAKDVPNGGINRGRLVPTGGAPIRPKSDRARDAQSGQIIEWRQVDTVSLVQRQSAPSTGGAPSLTSYDLL